MPLHLPAILFDFDGVLADTEPLHWTCWNEVLAPLGVQIGWEEYQRYCVGISDREFLEVLGRHAQPQRTLDELWPLYPAKKKIFAARATSGTLVAAPIKQMLVELAAHPLAVVTSSSRQEIEAILSAEGILDRFQTLVYGDEVTKLKPDPEPYATAMQRLGVTSAIALEDSAPGKESARRAGCTLIEVGSASETPALIKAALVHFR